MSNKYNTQYKYTNEELDAIFNNVGALTTYIADDGWDPVFNSVNGIIAKKNKNDEVVQTISNNIIKSCKGCEPSVLDKKINDEIGKLQAGLSKLNIDIIQYLHEFNKNKLPMRTIPEDIQENDPDTVLDKNRTLPENKKPFKGKKSSKLVQAISSKIIESCKGCEPSVLDKKINDEVGKLSKKLSKLSMGVIEYLHEFNKNKLPMRTIPEDIQENDPDTVLDKNRTLPKYNTTNGEKLQHNGV